MNSIVNPKVTFAQESATSLSLPQQINRMDSERMRAYRENLDFYNGTQWLGRSRTRERRLTFNYAKVFVDKVTSYLMSGLSFAIDALSPEDKEKARRAEEALYRVYGACCTNPSSQMISSGKIEASGEGGRDGVQLD